MSLNDWELSFNGLTIGGYTDYDLTSFEGFEGFEVRTNDEVLPALWGVLPGGDFVQPRSVIIGVQAYPELSTEAATFEAAFTPSSQANPTELSALTFKLPDQVEKRIMCRCRRRIRTRSNGRAGTEMALWLVQLDAPDPRVYASDESSTSGSPYLPDSEALEFPESSGADAAFDLIEGSGADAAFDFGGTPGGGTISVINAGNTDTYPTLTFSTVSTLDAWTLINDTTGEQVSFVASLDSDSELVADMAAIATGATGPVITIDGAARYSTWQTPRTPLRLTPGTNVLRFLVTDGPTNDPAVLISWRDAWI